MKPSSKVKFRFFPAKFVWAAIHPNPTGIVYFIGGAFFGSFPTLFYRFFLRSLFNQGYTVIALPFRFSFHHWSIALSFLENQHDILQAIEEEAAKQAFELGLYTEARKAASIDQKPYRNYWIGHSLGCKYIGLLELLTDFEMFERKDALCQCVGRPQTNYIDTLVDKSTLEKVSLYNQPSVLIDPVVADLDNAIPIKTLQRLFSRVIKVLPSRKETFCLVKRSRLFSLTSIISFESRLSYESVSQLKVILGKRLSRYQRVAIDDSWIGKHLSILGINSGNRKIVAAVIEQLRSYSIRGEY